jgi:uncharacterized membrane protein (DUF4010 family)
VDTYRVFEALGISLGLGLLVGLQREWAGSRIAGVRTFPLITLLGTVSQLIGEVTGVWIVAAALIGLVITTATANFMALKQDGARGTGLTTEVAIVLMFIIGAYAAVGPPAVTLALGATVAVLLHLKGGLHGFASKIGETDMRAIMLFAAIAFIVLPVLPDANYGPWGVWNPRNIWLVVVLVVGISLGGYVAYKVLGAGAGAILGGILGGLISSTATTVSYSRRAAAAPTLAHASLLVIMLATAVMYLRLIVLVAVMAPGFLGAAGPPLAFLTALAIAISAAAWLLAGHSNGQLPEQDNPTELKSALVFAVLYAIVLLAVAAGRRVAGESGIYVVSAISGLTDTAAITLSNARLVQWGELAVSVGWRAILVAVIANLIFKGGVVAVLGSRRLAAMVIAGFALHALAAGAVIALWPEAWRVDMGTFGMELPDTSPTNEVPTGVENPVEQSPR